MTREEFRALHSDIIMEFQCIENDLKMIYASIREGNFDRNMDLLDNASLGQTIIELKKVDRSDDHPDLSDEDYAVLNRIREMRNYWCHECYLEYIYIQNDLMREEMFQKIAKRLDREESQVYRLHEHVEKLRLMKLKEYNRV